MEDPKDKKPFITKTISMNWEAAKNCARTTLEKLKSVPRGVQPSDSGELPRLLVGPVIGKVTSTSARILIEVDRDEDVTVMALEDTTTPSVTSSSSSLSHSGSLLRKLGTTLGSFSWRRTDDNPHDNVFSSASNLSTRVLNVQQQVIGKRPTVFVLEGLAPDTRYSVEVHCLDGPINGVAMGSSFKTFPLYYDPDTLNVGAISCNKIFVTRKEIPSHTDLWAHLAKAIDTRKLDLLVHIGDQIYGDGDKRSDIKEKDDYDKWSDRYHKAQKKLKKIDSNEWESYRDEICESYREVYRETWQHPPTAKCLANCPNLMIYDDHEIRDNWGDVVDDWRQDSLEYFIAHCAWIVSMEYQRQLHEDVDFNNLQNINKDYHFHVLGNVGFMFLDIRGSRTFHRVKNDENPYLGSRQWKDIEESLGGDGLFKDVKMLVVCSPAPLVFLHQTITSTAANSVNKLEDFKGHWSVHPKEQLRFITCLFNWKKSTNNRDILVLGGDVHCGGHSYILHSKTTSLRQLTTSAIANRPLPKSVYYTLRLAEQLGSLKQHYTFNHHNWTRSRNYGILQIRNHRNEDKGQPIFTAQLISANRVAIKMGRKISNHQEGSSASWRRLSYATQFYSSLLCSVGEQRRLMIQD